MKKKAPLILTFTVIAAVVAVACYSFWTPKVNQSEPVAVLPDKLFGWKFPEIFLATTTPSAITGRNLFDFQIAFSDIRDPGGIPSGLPVRLKIPVIKVDAAIEDALITPDGRMDVPAGSVNVAWFALGPHPGRVGSAVIGGHFGINKGVKFVFYDLDKLKVGDKIYILDDGGNTLAFQVRTIKLFDRNADATEVFTSGDGLAHLNLITCEGVWNQVNGIYPQRRVVFTDAIPPEGAVAVKPSLPSAGTSTPSPSTVTPKPQITPPAPTASEAPVTLATATPAEKPEKTPVENIPELTVATSSPTRLSTAFLALKSLYSTPLDGLVSSLLLISIIFLIFKILLPQNNKPKS